MKNQPKPSTLLEDAQTAIAAFSAERLAALCLTHGDDKGETLFQGVRLVTGIIRLREMASRTAPQLATIVGGEIEIAAVSLVVRQLQGKALGDESVSPEDREAVDKWIGILKGEMTLQEQHLRDVRVSLFNDRPRIIT